MHNFILELYSEEIPAAMQAQAAADLAQKIQTFLAGFEVTASQIDSYVTPQRLAVLAYGLPENLPGKREEKKGPRINAPEKAVQGFLRTNNLSNNLPGNRQGTDALNVREDPKGAFYVLEINQRDRPLTDALAEFLPDMITSFSWPKSMRWGRSSLRWVRPLRGILCCLGGQIVPFEVDALASGNVTCGHRFMAPDALTITGADDYVESLKKAHVLVDPVVREAIIVEDATRLAAMIGCQLVEDAALLSETAGLVEWPVPLLGKIDDEFMDMPEEVLISVMRMHQKYLALRDGDGRLAPYFVTVSNMVTDDQGAVIIAGNERVLRARLADGRFFWDQDRQVTLTERLPKLEKIIFQARLGTIGQKAVRIEVLTGLTAVTFSADAQVAQQSARLCKADLVSGMVYEFPELQGIMGGYYAIHDGLGGAVAGTIRDHYKPLGPNDAIAETAEGQSLALADKIDTLTGFWSINEKPTGSKDPYALRRAALGVIRILFETNTRMSLLPVFARGFALHGVTKKETAVLSDDLMGFIGDRLKVFLRGRGVGHDVVNAVFTNGSDDVVDMAARAEKLAAFLSTADGGNLLAAYRRAYGICDKTDNKAAGHKASGAGGDAHKVVVPGAFVQAEETVLYQAIEGLGDAALDSFTAFQTYLDDLATLRVPLDQFFEAVMINDDDASIKQNRLNLLHSLIIKMRRAAAFELIK